MFCCLTFLGFFASLPTACNPKKQLKPNRGSIKQAFILSGTGTCAQLDYDAPTTKEDIESVAGKVGACPSSVPVGSFTANLVKVCKPTKSKKLTTTYSIYSKVLANDGTVSDMNVEGASVYCQSLENASSGN